MALVPIESKGSEQKPFFDAWQKELSSQRLEILNEEEEIAISFKEPSSGKGYIVEFEEFILFLWGNSGYGKVIETLFEELDPSGETRPAFGIKFVLKRKKLDYICGFFDDADRVYTFESKTQEKIELITQEEFIAKQEMLGKVLAARKERDKQRSETIKRIDKTLASKTTPKLSQEK